MYIIIIIVIGKNFLAFVGLLQEMIIVQVLPLNVVHIILGWVLSTLCIDFKAQEPRSIPTPPMKSLTEFFHVDNETNVHLLPVPWYFNSIDYGNVYVVTSIQCLFCAQLQML